MTPDDRLHALLLETAAQLERMRLQQHAKQYGLTDGRMAPSTVCRVFQGKDHRVSTLVKIADALECDVTITVTKRTA